VLQVSIVNVSYRKVENFKEGDGDNSTQNGI